MCIVSDAGGTRKRRRLVDLMLPGSDGDLTATKKPTVLCVYHYYAHYRLPVLAELANSQRFKFLFAAGSTSEISIRLVPDELFAEVPGAGLSIHRLINRWISGGPLLYQHGLLSLINGARPRAVIFLGSPYFLSTWLAVSLCRALGIKVLFWTHGAFRQGGLKDRIRLSFFRLSDELLLYGEHARLKLSRAGFTPDRMTVIYNSLDAAVQLELARKALTGCNMTPPPVGEDRQINVIYCGRLTHHKKLEQLIEAGVILRRGGWQVNVLLVGDGEARDTLREQAAQCEGGAWVRFHGPCYDEAVLAELFFWAQVCVAPGEVGLTAMHSLAYGTPVVTHSDMDLQMPEAEAIVDGRTGATFEIGSVESLADAIVRASRLKVAGRPSLECMRVIENVYNPTNQRDLIEGALTKVLAK